MTENIAASVPRGKKMWSSLSSQELKNFENFKVKLLFENNNSNKIGVESCL